MGFFGKLFEKKEIVEYYHLYEWLKQKESSIVSADLLKSLNSELFELNNCLAQESLMLEGVELMNDVPQRIMQIIDGNKQEAIRQLRIFAGWCKMPLNNAEAHDLLKESGKKLYELSESTKKAFSVLSEFYRDNVKQILDVLYKYEALFSKFAFKYNNTKLQAINNAVKILDERKEEDMKRSIVASRKEELQEQTEKLKTKKALLNIELAQLENNHGLLAAKSRLQEFKDKEAELHNLIRGLFSPLQDAFVKYAHMAVQYEDLLKSYVNDSVSGFGADIKLNVLSAIQGIRYSIDELELKDAKLDKTKQALAAVNDDELTILHKDYANLSRKISETEKSIQDSSVLRSIKEIQNTLALVQLTENKLNEDFQSILRQIASFSAQNNDELIMILNKISPVTLMP